MMEHKKTKTMSGEYRAQVVSVSDPDKLLRVQVRIPDLWAGVADEDLPWAEYKLASARPRAGEFSPAEIDDWVWVDFLNGDTRYPRITGWCHFAPDGVPNLPNEAFDGPDKIDHVTKHGMPDPSEPVYHGSEVKERHGFVIEINPDGELLATQRATGSAIRMTKDGTISIYSKGDSYRVVDGQSIELVGQDKTDDLEASWTVNAATKVTVNCPLIDLGEASDLEPSVLGDKMADWIEGTLKSYLDDHMHIGNLGFDTGPSMLSTFGPFEPAAGAKGGGVYSKKNRNQ